MWGGAARMGGELMGVRDAIGTVCRVCRALKAWRLPAPGDQAQL